MLELALARQLGASFKTYNWNMIFSEIPGRSAKELEALSLRCNSSSLPGFTSDSFDRWFMGVRVAREPGRTLWEPTWELGFVEGDDLIVYKIIMGWRKDVHDPSDGSALAEVPRADIPMKLLNDAGDVKLTVAMIEAYPEALNPMDLRWEGGEIGAHSARFTFNDIRIVE